MGQKDQKEKCKRNIKIRCIYVVVSRQYIETYHVGIMTELWTSQYWLGNSSFDSSDTLGRAFSYK